LIEAIYYGIVSNTARKQSIEKAIN